MEILSFLFRYIPPWMSIPVAVIGLFAIHHVVQHTLSQTGTPKRPQCPLCGSSMELRRAKRGKHAGKEFWGCSHCPECPGIVNL